MDPLSGRNDRCMVVGLGIASVFLDLHQAVVTDWPLCQLRGAALRGERIGAAATVEASDFPRFGRGVPGTLLDHHDLRAYLRGDDRATEYRAAVIEHADDIAGRDPALAGILGMQMDRL